MRDIGVIQRSEFLSRSRITVYNAVAVLKIDCVRQIQNIISDAADTSVLIVNHISVGIVTEIVIGVAVVMVAFTRIDEGLETVVGYLGNLVAVVSKMQIVHHILLVPTLQGLDVALQVVGETLRIIIVHHGIVENNISPFVSVQLIVLAYISVQLVAISPGLNSDVAVIILIAMHLTSGKDTNLFWKIQ